MTSRRAVLASLGTVGIAGVAGCSALPVGDEAGDDTEGVSLPTDAVEPIEWPASPFPATVPSTLADAHRERARELLAAVPANPSIPNGAVAEELRADRERAADRLEDDVDEPWPTEALSRWRGRRNTAATVRGTYRGATGEDDGTTVSERRRAVREDLGSFVAAHEYRASSPLEAVLAHAPIEGLLADCRRRARPDPAYPADPVASPFQAGDAVGRVELARATLADARGLHETYLSDRPQASAQWTALIDATERLGLAVARTRSTVGDFLDVDGPPFEADLEGTAGRWLFVRAQRLVESTTESHEGSRTGGDYATAAIEAGRTLAAVEALRTAVVGIRDDAYQDAVTVESVTRTAERAREAIAAVDASEDRRLATRVVRPALETFDYLPKRIEEGYADAARVQGELAWAELYARAVPAATGFVIDRLGDPATASVSNLSRIS